MTRTVTTIPATRHLFTGAKLNQPTVRKVAGYARVSTDHEDQATSYEAQVDYYTNYITARPDWELVKIYTDEGISGTSVKRRQGFKTMVADAMDGKIDLIITKSVSRFARNTVDALTYIRKLKERGVEIFFEKENIYTMDSKGELMLTIMSSLAQEEARSISENVTWGHRKRFADGKAIIPYGSVLGYKRGENDTLVIDENEAPTVRRIYELFLQGYSLGIIAKKLMAEGHKPAHGKSKWSTTSVRAILKNEKYRGDLLIQKTVVVDFLTKQTKKNEGEAPQYYIEGNHEPIIPPEVWDQVQYELKNRYLRRTSKKMKYSSFLRCSCCGSYYGPKQTHSGTKYRKDFWLCRNKYGGDKVCTSKRISEEMIEVAFHKALDKLRSRLEVEGRLMEKVLESTLDRSKEKALLEEIESRLSDVVPRLEELSSKLSGRFTEETELASQEYVTLYEEYERLYAEQKSLQENIDSAEQRLTAIRRSFELFKSGKSEQLLAGSLWNILIDEAIVYEDAIEFVFQNGMRIKEQL